MKKISVLLTLMVVFAFLVSPASAIIGGETDFEHTNVGAVVMQLPALDYTLARVCTATLIHSQALVSAAHCFEGTAVAEEPLYITFKQDPISGNPDPATDPEYYAVASYIYHPDYNWMKGKLNSTHDIALIILKEPMSADIDPEPLPDMGYLEEVISLDVKKGTHDIDFTIVGFGGQEFLLSPERYTDPENATRNVGLVSFHSLETYEFYTFHGLENDNICFGDSGGPIFHINEQEGEVMVGINGTGGGACFDGSVGGHYRLDTEYAQEWINAQLDQLE
ncbi:trypsin-like serine protease [Chloroflexota bacterium]